MQAELDEHVLREIIRIALKQDWTFYAVAQCISKTVARLARELTQEHPAPQRFHFVSSPLAPLPRSDASIYWWGSRGTAFHKTLSFKGWQPFQYPIVDWTECKPSSETWAQIVLANWSMLRTSLTMHLYADPTAEELWMWKMSFLEALVFESEPQRVKLWVNGWSPVYLEPDSHGIVWLGMLPGACIPYSKIEFSTNEPAVVRLIHHQCRESNYELNRVINSEIGPGPWSVTLGNVEFILCDGNISPLERCEVYPVRSWTSAFRQRLRHALDDVCTWGL